MKVYDSNKKVIDIDESKELARGGEGRIIQIANNKVAKLYLPGIKPISEDQFNALYQLKANCFVKPEILLYNKQNKIVGFYMNMIPADYYPLYSALNMNFCNRHNIDSAYKLRMCTKLIDNVSYAHKQNTIIGDLNPFNISINDACGLYFIDVDSYETPGHKHSGRLLDDIRDYLYNGQVNINSDYFALSVIIFNFLTNVHPFKGVHKKYAAMSDRMIKKIPVTKKDPDLIVPKCYQPLTDKFLIEQFEKIFVHGDRFLLSLTPSMKIQVKQPVKVKQQDDQLMIYEILNNITIKYIDASINRLCVHTDAQTIVYDVSYKGIFKELGRIDKKYETYTIKDRVYFRNDNKLCYVDKFADGPKEITNFEFNSELHINQRENILTVVTESTKYDLHLDHVINSVNSTTGKVNNDMKIETQNIFGRGFNYNGTVQYINGKSYIYYNNKNVLNILSFTAGSVKDLVQEFNVGIAQIYENDKVKYNFFSVNGLKVEVDTTDLGGLRSFGYKENSFIILPQDDALSFRRVVDFGEIANFKCNLVDEGSEVCITDAGIVVNNGNGVYLINKK